MTTRTRSIVTALWLAGMTCTTLAFDCPDQSLVADPDLLPIVKNLLPSGDDLIARDQLQSAAFELRQRRIPDDQAVNSLFAAYCPRIADNVALDEAEKNDHAAAFLTMARRVVYGEAN